LALSVEDGELSGGPRAVFHNDWLAELFRKLGRDDPGYEIIAAAGSKSDHDPDGLVGVICGLLLCRRPARQNGRQGGARQYAR